MSILRDRLLAALVVTPLLLASAHAVQAADDDDRSLFDQNSNAIRNQEAQGNVGGRATGPDTGPPDPRLALPPSGLGGGAQGGNNQGGANMQAIQRPNE